MREIEGKKVINTDIRPALSSRFLSEMWELEGFWCPQGLSKAPELVCDSEALGPCSKPSEFGGNVDCSVILCHSATGTGHPLSGSFWVFISFKN